MKIRANKKVTLSRDVIKTINVHFNNNDHQTIKIDGVSIGSFVNGATVELQVPEPRRYLKFTGYKYHDKDDQEVIINYDPDTADSLYYVVDTTGDFRLCEIESIWIDYYHWELSLIQLIKVLNTKSTHNKLQ